MADFDTEYTDFPTCPHCGQEEFNWWDDLGGSKRDGDQWSTDCANCGNEYHVTIYETRVFDTKKTNAAESVGVDDGYPVDDVLDILLLTFGGGFGEQEWMAEHDATMKEVISGWSDEQRRRAVDYASSVYLSANDNDSVKIPEKPQCLIDMMKRMGCQFA